MALLLVIIILVLRVNVIHSQMVKDALSVAEEKPVSYLVNSAADLIQRTSVRSWKMEILRQSYRGSAEYEIGFLVRTTEERYRKMVDLYNTSVTMGNRLRAREHILYLQQIEKLHWDITHLANMVHEVERKYRISPEVMMTRDFTPWGYMLNTTTVTVTTTEESDSHTEDGD